MINGDEVQGASSSQDPILKKRAKTSSEPRLNTSTPLAGSQTLPPFLIAGAVGWLSAGDVGPNDDGGEPRDESLDRRRLPPDE